MKLLIIPARFRPRRWSSFGLFLNTLSMHSCTPLNVFPSSVVFKLRARLLSLQLETWKHFKKWDKLITPFSEPLNMDKTWVDAHTRNPAVWLAHVQSVCLHSLFFSSVIHWPAGMDNPEAVRFVVAVKRVAVWVWLRSWKVVSEVLPWFSDLFWQKEACSDCFSSLKC